MVELAIAPRGAKLPAAVTELASAIEADGGAALAAYQEPIGDHWHLFAMLPIAKVEATPYQRDLSPAHLKRMIEVMKKLDRFTEPIVAVHSAGTYWTPNGNHRRAAAVKSGAKMIPAIVIPDPEVAFQILALNTEKAHNLRDKALEVMARALAQLGSNPFVLGAAGTAYGMLGQPEKARECLRRIELLGETRYVSPLATGWVHMGLGDVERCLDWFEAAVEERDPQVIHFPVKAMYDSLRGHPRFEALVRRMGLG